MIHNDSNFKLNLTYNFKGTASSAKNINCCPDQFVGGIVFNGAKFTNLNGKNVIDILCKSNKNSANKRVDVNYSSFSSNNSVVVLLMESPHILEYLAAVPSPAWGRTGTMINKHFLAAMNNSLKNIQPKLNCIRNQKFNLILVNAIRYQCSLGISPLKTVTRNNVFKDLWDNRGFQCDLCDRLRIIKPSLIINAITSDLKSRCNLNKPPLNRYAVITLETNHPSKWDASTQFN